MIDDFKVCAFFLSVFCFVLIRIKNLEMMHDCYCKFLFIITWSFYFLQTDDDRDSGTESDDEGAEIEELQKCKFLISEDFLLEVFIIFVCIMNNDWLLHCC